MGSTVMAKCKCGFEGVYLIGGGMMPETDTAFFPAFCPTCKEIVVVDFNSDAAACPECENRQVMPYDDDQLVVERGPTIVAQWLATGDAERSLTLTNGRYYCPSCRTFGLTFEHEGTLWD